MFQSLLKTDFFETIENNASDTVIKKDRLFYKPVFDLVLETISNDTFYTDKMIFSDINKILKKSDDTIPNSIIIYTTHTRKMATILSNIIHKNFGKFVQMRSIIPNEEYNIMYNMRNVVKIYRIERYKKVMLDKLFNAINIKNLFYFPAEIELIDIYHKLYLPNFNEEWPSLINNEYDLHKSLLDMRKGGACTNCKIKRKIDIYQIKHLMLNFLNNESYVMVGKCAHNFITGNKDISDDPIQIISENDIEQDYDNIIQYLSSFTNYGISYTKKNLYIPKDNRIYKYTLYIKYPTFGKNIVDKPFLDIYNCGSYELIPYTLIDAGNKIKVGNIYVQLRFIMIDLWLLRLVKYLEGIDEAVFNTAREYLFSAIDIMRKKMSENVKYSYIGINYSEMVAQKIEISEKQIKKDIYYPELSIKTTKKYKLIATS